VIPFSEFLTQNMKGTDYLKQLGLTCKAILQPNTKHEILEVSYSKHSHCIHLRPCISVSYRISSYFMQYIARFDRKVGKRLRNTYACCRRRRIKR